MEWLQRSASKQNQSPDSYCRCAAFHGGHFAGCLCAGQVLIAGSCRGGALFLGFAHPPGAWAQAGSDGARTVQGRIGFYLAVIRRTVDYVSTFCFYRRLVWVFIERG